MQAIICIVMLQYEPVKLNPFVFEGRQKLCPLYINRAGENYSEIYIGLDEKSETNNPQKERQNAGIK